MSVVSFIGGLPVEGELSEITSQTVIYVPKPGLRAVWTTYMYVYICIYTYIYMYVYIYKLYHSDDVTVYYMQRWYIQLVHLAWGGIATVTSLL